MRKFSVRKAWFAVAALAFFGAPAAKAQDSLKLLQPDTDLVITVKMKEMIDAPVIKKYALEHLKAALNSNAEAKKAMETVGIDPMKDLEKMTVGVGMKDPNKPSVTVVVDGNFNASKINEMIKAEATKKKEKLESSEVGGKTVFQLPGSPGGEPMFLSVVSDKQVVLGSKKEFVADAIAAKGNGVGKALADAVAKADSKAVITISANMKELLAKAPIPPLDDDKKKIVAKIVDFNLGIILTNDVNLSIALGAADTASADELVTFLNPMVDQVKGLAPLLGGNLPPELKPLLDFVKTIAVEKKDKAAVISGSLKEEIIEKVAPKK